MGIHDIQDYNHESLDNLNSLQRTTNTKLDNVITNTANIKASLEVGGDLIINVDDLEGLQTTANGHLSTIAGASTTLPTGASTSAKQDTGNTSLNNIDNKLPSALTGSGNIKVCIQELGNEGSERLNTQALLNQLPTALTGSGNLKVSLEQMDTSGTGIATSAKQDTLATKLDTGNTSLGSIDGKISACNTGAVVISSQALPTGASTSAKQDTINTSLTPLNSFAFIEAQTDFTSNPPAGTTKLLLTQDITSAFLQTSILASVDSVDTKATETNSVLTTIDTDTGNIDSKLGALNTLTNANNTIHAAIKNDTANITNIDNKLPSALTGSGNLKVCIQELGNEGSEKLNTEASVSQLPSALTGSGNLKVSLEQVDTSGTGIATSAKQDDTNTKIDTTNTHLSSVIGTASGAYSGKGVVLMGKVGDITGDGIHDDTGIAQNDAQFIACDPFGNIGVTMSGGLMENSIEYNSGNKTAKTQRVVIATDDIPIALVNTKLDTIASRLFDDNKSVATGVNGINTNIITALSKLDDVITLLNDINNKTGQSGHFGNP